MENKLESLELYTTKEMIEEIINRTTFQGIMILSENDCKDPKWCGKKTFGVHWNNNLTNKEVVDILESTAFSLRENNENDGDEK